MYVLQMTIVNEFTLKKYGGFVLKFTTICSFDNNSALVLLMNVSIGLLPKPLKSVCKNYGNSDLRTTKRR